jgi:hypothetical protein
LLKAQRVSIATAGANQPVMYFSSVGVIPEFDEINERQLLNTGRSIVKYLADINISLTSEVDYTREESFRGPAYIDDRSNQTTITPWDSLALISNEIMVSTDEKIDQSKIEERANQYIAQAVFGIATANAAPDSYKYQGEDEHVDSTDTTFRTVRLDVNDLRTGLIGPYSTCFAQSESALGEEAATDQLVLRAISPPSVRVFGNGADEESVVEGISILPQKREKYIQTLGALAQIVAPTSSNKSSGRALTKDDLAQLNKLAFFKRCARIVCVISVPSKKDLHPSVSKRIVTLLSWLFPNLREPRRAIVYGTSKRLALSLYVQGSVVLTPSIEMAITNYLHKYWNKRTCDPAEFYKKYLELTGTKKPVSAKEVEEWLGPNELYGDNNARFAEFSSDFETRWSREIEQRVPDKTPLKKVLKQLTFGSLMISPAEIAAALNYISYVSNIERLKTVVPTRDE